MSNFGLIDKNEILFNVPASFYTYKNNFIKNNEAKK